MKRLFALLLLPLLLGAGVESFKSVSLVTYGADTTGTFDTSAAWIAAVNAGASHIDLPPGQYLLNGTATVNLTNIEVECHGAPAQYNNNGGAPAYGTSGATILLTSTSVQPFALAAGVRFKNCNFFWPNQTGVNPTPTAYPALFTEQAGKQLNGFWCISCRVINAYDFMDQASTAGTDAFGDMHLIDTSGYAIRYWFQLADVPEFWEVVGFHSDFGIYQGVSNNPPNYYLANWTAANGAFLHAFGNGNGSSVGSTVCVQGLTFTGGGLFAYNKFIWVDSTGCLSETNIAAAIVDSVPHAVQVDTGACVADLNIDGSYYSYQWVSPAGGPGGTDNATTFSFGTPPTGGSCITSNIRITGHLFSAQADVVDITGTNNKYFYVNISGGGSYGNTSTAGTYYFSQVNSSTAIVDFVGNHVEPKTAGATRLGFNLVSCFSCTLTGNSFNGVYNAVLLGSSTVPVSGAGNVAVSTPVGGLPIVGTGDFVHQLLGPQNTWDKYANPTVSACGAGPSGSISNGKSTDVSGVVTVGGGAVTSCTVNFANAYTSGARCMVAGISLAAAPYVVTPLSTTSFILTTTATMNGQTFWYHCDGGW